MCIYYIRQLLSTQGTTHFGISTVIEICFNLVYYPSDFNAFVLSVTF